MRYELQRARDLRELVRLEREGIHAEAVTGFPLVLGGELVLLHRLDDFDLAGHAIVRLADVSDVLRGDLEQFTERVMREEGQLERVGAPEPAVPVGDWGEAFEALRASGRIVIVECEDFEEEEFYIGRITRVRGDAVIFHHFDAVAVWDEEATAIPFAEITRVRFNERYTDVFGPYVGEPPES